jgi:hypothetical protein
LIGAGASSLPLGREQSSNDRGTKFSISLAEASRSPPAANVNLKPVRCFSEPIVNQFTCAR